MKKTYFKNENEKKNNKKSLLDPLALSVKLDQLNQLRKINCLLI